MELSPIDVLLFDEIYSTDKTMKWNNFKLEFSKKHSISQEDVSFCFDNLFRLSLIYNTNNGLYKTQYGKSFYKACRKY
jgi:hypothetical protein